MTLEVGREASHLRRGANDFGDWPEDQSRSGGSGGLAGNVSGTATTPAASVHRRAEFPAKMLTLEGGS